jgi:leucyl aminopeptidase
MEFYMPEFAPRFAPDDAVTRPIYVVEEAGLAAFLAGLPPMQAAWLVAVGFKAGLGAVVLLPDAGGAVVAAVVGNGTGSARARRRFGMAGVAVAVPAGDWHFEGGLEGAALEEAALGWFLAQYRFDRYKPVARDVARLALPVGVDGARVIAMAQAEVLTRDLINTPASDMGPAEMEAAFCALATRHGATASVIVGDDLLAQNFPMIHAVGRASTRAPRLLDMQWGDAGLLLVLVGKGVCFDTGGLDIKPSSGMVLMKKDMGGAATVLGLAHMIMALGLRLRLRVLVPAVENAISGAAMRPKDILTSRKGLTVEVNNTDAEGRLVLADALAYACEGKPDLVISMATLTGAARVAVGPDLAPFFTDDDGFAVALTNGGAQSADPVWRLPLWPGYEAMIEPGIADLDNAPAGGFAGASTAALFLRRFVDTPNYVHFDIYGHQPTAAPARPQGGAGQGARAILYALPAMLGATL